MKPEKSGWGAKGLLLNSGWNWQPTKYGWAVRGSSTISSLHPITKGLPAKWLHAKDELYCKLCGPAEHVEVQGTALSPQTKRHEPMLLTITFGKGRVFHTPMGHDVEAMRCRGFYELLQRGTEWSVSGKVERTAEVPADFPTADKVVPVPAP